VPQGIACFGKRPENESKHGGHHHGSKTSLGREVEHGRITFRLPHEETDPLDEYSVSKDSDVSGADPNAKYEGLLQ
jgi:hypothetical protein